MPGAAGQPGQAAVWEPDRRPGPLGDPVARPSQELVVADPFRLTPQRSIDPRSAVPPTLGEHVPRAARSPWRLPQEPAQPGIAADEAELGDLIVRAASIVGPGHRCEDPAGPRQDAYRIGRDHSGDHLLIAVADGMTDSGRSDFGAVAAVAQTIALLRKALIAGTALTDLSATSVFGSAANGMVAAARSNGYPPDDIRCTLLAAVVPARPDRHGRRRMWVGGLADTTAWLAVDRGWRLVAGEDKRGSSSNAVQFYLPHAPHEARTSVITLENRGAVAFVTDGIGDVLGDAGSAHWFADRWYQPPPIASFLLDVGYEARHQLDDRTAVVVWWGQ
jgi:hypothetical protein